MDQVMNMEDGSLRKTGNYTTLISPRGGRERMYTKRQQFDQMIEGDKDNVKEKLRTLVKPYQKTAAYESYRQAGPMTYRPPMSNTVQMPINFAHVPGTVASNKGSVAKFEDQKLGHGDNNLDDTFTREEKNLTASASVPTIRSNAMRRYNNGPYDIDDDDDNEYAEKLKLMYPEPGLKNTFVKGVYNDSLVAKKRYLSPETAVQSNPYYALDNTYSQRKMGSVAFSRNTMKEATNFGNGHPPSYGRIIGLSRRLDTDVKHKMRYVDALKDHQDAIKQLVDQEKSVSGFNDVKSSYGSHSQSQIPYTQFQKNALNVINNRS